MAKVPGKCIFCGGGGLSKQHIIAKWVQSVVPKVDSGVIHGFTDWGFSSGTAGVIKHPPRSSPRPNRQGDLLNVKLYRVCKTCNSGWMSRLEERAKPFLIPLLTGEWTELSPEGQELVSAWIAMVTMVNEFGDPSNIGISAAERAKFMRTQEPGPNWWIAIGLFGRTSREIMHTGAIIWPGQKPDPANVQSNTQTTSGIIGRLLFQNFSSSVIRISPDDETLLRLGLTQIWPPKTHPVRPVRSLSDPEAALISVALRRSIAAAFQG